MSERTIAQRVAELEAGFAKVLEAPTNGKLAEQLSDHAIVLEALWTTQLYVLGALAGLGLLVLVLAIGALL